MFSFFKKKKDKKNKNLPDYDGAIEQDGVYEEPINILKSIESGTDVLTMAKENHEIMKDMQRRLEEAKWEYDSVTTYLLDIQKIDALSLDKRAEIDDSARKIINLNKEREKYQLKELNPNDPQFRIVKQYEDRIMQEIEKMEEQETYQQMVKNDLKHLEGERGTIIYEKENAIEKRAFIKKFSIVISVVVLVIFTLLFLLNDMVDANLSVPFFLAGIMGLVALAYCVIGLRNSTVVYKTADVKMNRLISLVNKVKIKYVNVTNILDYMYDKYHVNSSKELNMLWVKYIEAKDEAKLYSQNTEMLEMSHNILIEALKSHEVQDPEVWIYQPEALLDDKEMVEVRHHLNVRRQKLRERIDFNNKQIEQCKNVITELRKRYPEYEQTITGIMHL